MADPEGSLGCWLDNFINIITTPEEETMTDQEPTVARVATSKMPEIPEHFRNKTVLADWLQAIFDEDQLLEQDLPRATFIRIANELYTNVRPFITAKAEEVSRKELRDTLDKERRRSADMRRDLAKLTHALERLGTEARILRDTAEMLEQTEAGREHANTLRMMAGGMEIAERAMLAALEAGSGE